MRLQKHFIKDEKRCVSIVIRTKYSNVFDNLIKFKFQQNNYISSNKETKDFTLCNFAAKLTFFADIKWQQLYKLIRYNYED